ncbi:MAG: DUF2079 domain-containing protein [Actinomyces bowdenii]|nr:DUF2079 domain-containing protein [Actinomyces bowdenii]
MRLTRLQEHIPSAIVVVIAAWVMITYSIAQWHAMQVPSWDLAIFSELAKAYSRLEAPIVPVKGDGYNLLGDHFHPILVLLGPVWRLFPSPLSLLIVQDLLLAASAWPLTRLAARLTNPWLGGVLGLVYALSWGLQGAVAAQFHEIAFAVPMLALATTAYVERRWMAVAAWSAPLVLVKEDLGLTVLVIGAAVAWTGRRERRAVRLGAGLAVFGMASFLLTVLVLLPALNPEGVWAYGLQTGAEDGAAPTPLLTRLFTPSVKLETLGVLVATCGLIGLRSPWILAVGPTLAWRFLGSIGFYWEWSNWHYNAVLMPIAFGALLDVVARLRAKGRWEPAPGGITPTGLPTSGWLTVPLPARYATIIGLGTTITACLALASHLPFWAMTQKGFETTNERAATAQEIINTIPRGSTVVTDLGMLAYLVPTAEVSWVGTSTSDKDYVVIDKKSTSWGGNAPTDAAQWAQDQSMEGSTYTLILDSDDYQVARRDR